MRPAWVRAGLAVAPSFGWRRRIVQAWIWSDTDPTWCKLRDLAYWSRRPVAWFRLQQRVRILLAGRGYIDA